MANKYFEKGQYYRAVPLLEELIPIYRGTEKSERLYYIYAYCDYYMQDYILAAHRFSTFVKTFPFSRFREDTYSALSQFQSFINQYPQSEKVDSCHVLLDELRQKLEEKSFQTSVQYYHTQHYKAALTALNNCIQDFPDTKHREEIVFLMVKANFNWAKNSVESKKEERFLNTKKAYAKFAGSYPESEFKKEALEVLDKVNEELELIKYKNS
jgi:outer membrane protein assembly factor BamD